MGSDPETKDAMASPNILIVLPAIIPSSQIGVLNPIKELHSRNLCKYRLLLESNIQRFWPTHEAMRELLSKYDLVIMCRNQSTVSLNIALEARRQWIPIIYDIDDNFFDISLASAVGRYHRNPLHLYQLEQIIEYASLVRVYSKPMHKHMDRLGVKYEVVDSYFDRNLIRGVRPARHKSTVRIAYPTSRTHDDLAEIFAVATLRLLEKYGKSIEIHFWSNIPGPLRRFKNVVQHDPIPNYTKFIRAFHKLNFDIGLAPLKNTIFHRSKTNNKYREYSGCSVAGVYSDVDVYTDCVENGRNGLIVENDPDSWYHALDLLISDPQLRKNITTEARKSIDSRFSFDRTVDRWKEQIHETLKVTPWESGIGPAASRPLPLMVISDIEVTSEQAPIDIEIKPPLASPSTELSYEGKNWTLQSTENQNSLERRKQRRLTEWQNVGKALGAKTRTMPANPEELARLNIDGIAIVIATTIEMMRAGLEIRANVLGLIIDITAICDDAGIKDVTRQIPAWEAAAPGAIFILPKAAEIPPSENRIIVPNELDETVEDIFSPSSRLYAAARAIDDLSRPLALSAVDQDEKTRLEKMSDQLLHQSRRIENLKVLLGLKK
ncbi:MAG: glycosyltransferase [Pseudomonadota bacterium]